MGMLSSLKDAVSGQSNNLESNETGSSTNSYGLLIGGELVQTGETLDVINPATEEIFTSVPLAGAGELEAAVAAATTAAKNFKSTSIEERQALIKKIVKAMGAHKEELALALVQEQGKSLDMARLEVDFSMGFAMHFTTVGLPIEVLLETDAQRVEIHRKPLGVVAGITAWNFPLLMAAYKLAPAILAGNAIILKPAPTTPVSTVMLGEIIKDIVPPGLVSILVDNNELGAKITSHPGIAKISFTGSIATGKKVMASGADTLKRVTLELGGNDAGIVLDAADPKAMAQNLFNVAFMNSGQVCIALKRLYVHDSIYDAICDEMAVLAKGAIVGDGMKDGTQFGPVQNKQQFEIIKGFIEDAKANGNIIAGGQVPDIPGYFIPLTVVRDISDGTKLVDEEPFGPILPIIKFSDIDEVIERSNRLDYGLGGSVWSSDVDKAVKVAEKMDTGTVWINSHMAFGPNIPFPPCKQSGVGVEWGKEGLNEFTSMQVINIAKG